MSDRVYQILYCSRNKMQGSDAEVRTQIEEILRASRVNNAKVGVTGALFYNTVFFAQVLEGTFSQVQGVFERLQLDGRHSDLVVLQNGYVAERNFGNWSMAYAGASADLALPFPPTMAVLADTPNRSLHGENVLTLLRDVVRNQETWALPERSYAKQPTYAANSLAQ